MKYKYNNLPLPQEGPKIFWIQLVRHYDGNHNDKFPFKMKTGDITWISENDIDDEMKFYHLENNRYWGNFDQKYFKIVDGPNTKIDNYEIY